MNVRIQIAKNNVFTLWFSPDSHENQEANAADKINVN